MESLKITKYAMLSRAVSGIRKQTLIINLPGSRKGSKESLLIVLPVLKHAIDLIRDSKNEIKNDHVLIQQSDHHQHHHCHKKSI
jgi:molybdopterin adenylyltransferase